MSHGADYVEFDPAVALAYGRRFPKTAANRFDQLTVPKNCTAAQLFRALFDIAKADFNLEADRLSEGQPCYAPWPVVDRLLDIVAETCKDCLTVTMLFSGREAVTAVVSEAGAEQDKVHGPPPMVRIRIPGGLSMHASKEEQNLIKMVARYVLSAPLNQAMSWGFTSCDIAVTGPTPQAAAGDGSLGAGEWRKLLKETYEREHFDVLNDHYLRDYNTRRPTVVFSDTIKEPQLAETNPAKIGARLQEWLDAQSGAGADRPPALVAGIDVGATLTKMQFYRIENSRFEPVCPPVRFRTPDPQQARQKKQLEREIREPPPSAQDDAALFSQEVCRRVDEFAYSRPEMREKLDQNAHLICAGTTWPGPVQSGHVVGTSGFLRRFGTFEQRITSNRVGEILQFDIAQALKTEIAAQQKRAIPTAPDFELALLNDADADAYAILSREPLPARLRVAILKLGSGTAAAVFDQRILPGLCEGGKFLLDLAALVPDGYPPGVANLAMSKKFLPAMAQALVSRTKRQKREPRFDLSRLDSQEIDHFLTDEVRTKQNIWLLVQELGLRDLADDEGEDVEVYRSVHSAAKSEREKAEPWLVRRVERKLNVAGDQVFDELTKRVIARGLTRLAGVLSCKTQAVDDLLKHRTHADGFQPAWLRIEQVIADVALPAAQALGRYLGDFLVLYHDLYGWNRIYVEGGVLSGAAAKIVRAAAQERAALYGFELAYDPQGSAFWTTEGATVTATPSAADAGTSHSGCLGAAIFAAGQFLRQQEQRGLQALRQAVLGMSPGGILKLTRSDIGPAGGDKISLAQHALLFDDVEKFLNDEADDLKITRRIATNASANELEFVRSAAANGHDRI